MSSFLSTTTTFVLLFLFVGCSTDSAESTTANYSALDILLMGDWGGSAITPKQTTCAEVSTAKRMEEQASIDDNIQMVWGLGDNIYPIGVHNENDPRFASTFEAVFDGPSLSKLPFFMVAGNHDHYGNVSGEIAYSSLNTQWHFPDYNYTKVFSIPNTKKNLTLQLVMVDTVILCGKSQDIEFCESQNISMDDCQLQPTGASDVQWAEEQWQWLTHTLAASTADFLIVAGHYPIWSVAEHGPTHCLVDRLRPLLIKYAVNFYLCGHDHTFQLVVEDAVPSLLYAVVGGSHLCQSSSAHTNDIPVGSLKFHGCKDGGFAKIHTNESGIQLQFFFGNSTDVQYSTKTYPPRKKLYLKDQ